MSADPNDPYFTFQRELAALLGCVSHPNNILGAIRDLKCRAATGVRERNDRAQLISDGMRMYMTDLGITEIELKSVDKTIDKLAEDIAWIDVTKKHATREIP